MKLRKREIGDPPGWKDKLTVEMTGWEYQVLLSSMFYIASEYDVLDTIRLNFKEAEADMVRDALYEMDEKVLENIE